jgi:hypothetical protein
MLQQSNPDLSLIPPLNVSYLSIYVISTSFIYTAWPDPANKTLFISNDGINISHNNVNYLSSLIPTKKYQYTSKIILRYKHILSSPLSMRVILKST